MRKTPLNKMLVLVVLSLAIVAFTQTPVVSAKDTKMRPFHISGQITGMPVESDKGVATHLGRFSLISQEGSIYTYVVSNGDEISWGIADIVMTDFPLIKGTMIFTGGTGRFENVEGYYDFSWDFGTGSYTGEGTIAY